MRPEIANVTVHPFVLPGASGADNRTRHRTSLGKVLEEVRDSLRHDDRYLEVGFVCDGDDPKDPASWTYRGVNDPEVRSRAEQRLAHYLEDNIVTTRKILGTEPRRPSGSASRVKLRAV